MIRTTIVALIEGRRYEFVAELPGTADWADSPEETAYGLLSDGVDQLERAMKGERGFEKTAKVAVNVQNTARAITDENGNRQCYLCGFYHDEPGSCATGTPQNVTPGPDLDDEYDGPTADYGAYMEHMPEHDENDDDENDRPFDDDEPVRMVVGVDPAEHDSKVSPLVARLRAAAEAIRCKAINPDITDAEIRCIKPYTHVKYDVIHLSENFGHGAVAWSDAE